MASGRRRYIVQQASLVWSQRGPAALERYIDWGSFDDGDDTEKIPYDQTYLNQIVTTGIFR